MRAFAWVVVATTVLLMSAVASHAADLFTPAVAVSQGKIFVCRLVNVGQMARDIAVEVRNGSGAVVGGGGGSLAAGTVGTDFAFIVPPGGTNNLYCRFGVKGPKSSVRASAIVRDGVGADAIVVVAQ